MTEEEALWIESNYGAARKLLDRSAEFMNAVQALGSYGWHANQNVQLAILWTGIEGLFKAQSEITFRISLYISHYLEPGDVARQREVFASVKDLYGYRSKVVHGRKLKDEGRNVVAESSDLLHRLVRKCVENKSLPNIDDLAP